LVLLRISVLSWLCILWGLLSRLLRVLRLLCVLRLLRLLHVLLRLLRILLGWRLLRILLSWRLLLVLLLLVLLLLLCLRGHRRHRTPRARLISLTNFFHNLVIHRVDAVVNDQHRHTGK